MHDVEEIAKALARKPSPCKPPGPTADATVSYWIGNGENGLASHGATDPLPERRQAVTIIGTGISGASALFHLVDGLPDTGGDPSQAREIVMIDARDFCTGATARNGGLLCCYVEMGFVARAAKNGIEQTRRDCLFEKRSIDFVVGLIEREGWTDVELSRDGVIALCETLDQAAELQNGLNLAKLNGIDVSKHRWIDLDVLRERFGLDGAAAALQLPGHSIYPLRLVNHLYRHAEALARKKGHTVRLFTRTPATSIDADGDDWIVRTDRGAIKTRYVIHATNAYASSLIPDLAHGRNAILPTRAQIITATTPSGQMPPARPGYVSTTEMYGQTRPDAYLMGGFGDDYGLADDSEIDANTGEHLRQCLRDNISAFAPSPSSGGILQPVLDCLGMASPAPLVDTKINVTYEWTGCIGNTRTMNPYIGQLVVDGKKVPRQYVVAGCSGHGMPRMPAGAEVTVRLLLADMLGQPAPVFDWLPDGYLMA